MVSSRYREAVVDLAFGRRLVFSGPADYLGILRYLEPYLSSHVAGQSPVKRASSGPDLTLDVRHGTPLGMAHRVRPSAVRDVFELPDAGPGTTLAIYDRRRCLTPAPRVFLVASKDRVRFQIWLAETDLYHRKLGKWFLVGLLAVFGFLYFAHASAVTADGGSIIILGSHGAGKSTLAAYAVLGGMKLLSEGVTLLDRSGRIIPFFMDGEPVLRLGAAAWQEVRCRLEKPPTPERYPSRGNGVREKVVLRECDGWPPSSRADPMPIRIAWLAASGWPISETLQIESISPSEAITSSASELQDYRITEMRRLLLPLPDVPDLAEELRRYWRRHFPTAAVRVGGTLDCAAFLQRLAIGGPRLV